MTAAILLNSTLFADEQTQKANSSAAALQKAEAVVKQAQSQIRRLSDELNAQQTACQQLQSEVDTKRAEVERANSSTNSAQQQIVEFLQV